MFPVLVHQFLSVLTSTSFADNPKMFAIFYSESVPYLRSVTKSYLVKGVDINFVIASVVK